MKESYCKAEGCNLSPIHSGLCEFHKWARYRETVLEKVEAKRIKMEKKLAGVAEVKLKKAFEKSVNVTHKRIYDLYKEGKTLREVGDMMGITGERVRQIVSKVPGYVRNKYSPEIIMSKCKECGKDVGTKKGHRIRTYCNRDCFRIYKDKHKPTLEEKRAAWNIRTKAYYHNVIKNRPDYHERLRIQNAKYKAKQDEWKRLRREKNMKKLSEILEKKPWLTAFHKPRKIQGMVIMTEWFHDVDILWHHKPEWRDWKWVKKEKRKQTIKRFHIHIIKEYSQKSE